MAKRTARLRTPIRWYGGKYYLSGRIVTLMPPHEVYVEPYFGSGAVLFAKDPSPVEVANDLNDELVSFFRVVRDDQLRGRLIELLDWTPYARREFEECLEPLPADADPVERARRFFLVCRASFSGTAAGRATPGRFSTSVVSRRGMAHRVSGFRSAIELLEPVGARLRTVLVEHLDGVDCIRRYDTPNTLHYVDPPYLPETRAKGATNDYADLEMTLEDHQRLAEMLRGVEGMVILSGYDNRLYDEWFSEWRKQAWDIACSASGHGTMRSKGAKKPRRQETVWLNPKAVETLKDAGNGELFE